MAKQEVKKKRTLVKFAVQCTEYEEGKGVTTVWKPICVQIGTDDYGAPIMSDCFYCEWLGSYGAAAIQQQADGVIRPARVRLTYVKRLYDALLNSDVKIYLHGLADDAHTFKLASAADDILQENKTLEFQVKKYEVR